MRLDEAPEIGRFYLVPCVWHRNQQAAGWLPIHGTLHTDPELGDAGKNKHYHFDWRFIAKGDLNRFFGHEDGKQDIASLMGHVHAPKLNAQGHAEEIRMLRRRCARQMPEFPIRGRSGNVHTLTRKVEEMCHGKRIDPANPICPHRGAFLRGLPVDKNNCVTCPGHGLRFNLTTGEMVSRYEGVEANS